MLSVTVEAQEKLSEVLESADSSDAAVRVAVVRGPHGCVHGWQLAVEGAQAADDVVIAAGPVRVVIEPDLVGYLDGATIGYQEDASGIGFTIDAPNTPPMGHGHEGGHEHGHEDGHGHGGGGGCCH